MKKQLIILFVFVVAGLVSCNKVGPSGSITGGTGSGTTTPLKSTNKWSLDGNEFIVTDTMTDWIHKNAITFFDFQSSTVSFFFDTYPTVSGDYDIVGAGPGPGEVHIMCGTIIPRTGFSSPGTDGKKLSVTVVDGRCTFKCVDILVEDKLTTPGTTVTKKLTTELIDP